MEINKIKNLVLKFGLDFLIGDFTSWKLLIRSNDNSRKKNEKVIKSHKKYSYKKVSIKAKKLAEKFHRIMVKNDGL